MVHLDKKRGSHVDFIAGSGMIADNAILSKHIAPETVIAADIAPDAVGSSELDDLAVSYAGQIKDDIITSAKVTFATGTAGDVFAPVTAGSIADDAIGSQHIDDDAISYQAQLGDDVIGSEQLIDSSVITDRIAADAIDGTKIIDDAIGSEHIADSAVITARIAADAVDGTKIIDDAIGSEHIDDDAIAYAAQIKDGVIGNDELAASGLDISKMTVGTAGVDRIPDLAATKITSGTFTVARIPDYAAYPIIEVVTGTPAADAAHIGRIYEVRTGAGAKTTVYMCVQNDANAYEYVQLAIST